MAQRRYSIIVKSWHGDSLPSTTVIKRLTLDGANKRAREIRTALAEKGFQSDVSVVMPAMKR